MSLQDGNDLSGSPEPNSGTPGPGNAKETSAIGMVGTAYYGPISTPVRYCPPPLFWHERAYALLGAAFTWTGDRLGAIGAGLDRLATRRSHALVRAALAEAFGPSDSVFITVTRPGLAPPVVTLNEPPPE